MAILTPQHLHRYEKFGDFNHRGKHLSREGKTFAMILDFRRFNAVDTLKRAMLQHATFSDIPKLIELSLSLEGFSVREQLKLLEKAQDQKFINSILIPEYTSQKDRLAILKKSNLPARLMEVDFDDIEEIKKFSTVRSISTSLPLRLGVVLRDFGEGPNPPPISGEEIPEARWTRRLVRAFVERVHE